MILLEQNKRLSDSMIWKMLEDFYDKASISAWNQIPFYPTSNPFIAETYAEMILAFLKDYAEHLDQSEPLYVLELACGSGCFSFYLLKELSKKLSYFSSLSKIQLKYVMTDFTENNVRSWESNPKLQPFIGSGLLEFAVFRPETDTKINLRLSARELAPGSLNNPLITIANYFFDSIRQDAFQIQSGQLMEAQHSFYQNTEIDNGSTSLSFSQLQKSENYVNANVDYYPDPELNEILRQYLSEYKDASILFPIGAFQCLRNISRLSKGKMVLLSSDKGFTDKAYMQGRHEQAFIAHHGIFSYSVNYDAIRRYCENRGGLSLCTTDDNLSVATTANFMVPRDQCRLEESTFYFQEKVSKQNISNYLYFLQDFIVQVDSSKKNEILRASLAYIQLCNFDPIAYCLTARLMQGALETSSTTQQERLLQVIIPHVRDNFYSLQQQFDVFYWIGRTYYGLNYILEAMQAFKESIAVFGQTSSSLYYLAACHEIRQELDKALQLYKETLQLEPNCQYTLAGIDRVSKQLEKHS